MPGQVLASASRRPCQHEAPSSICRHRHRDEEGSAQASMVEVKTSALGPHQGFRFSKPG
jgi:hypothetical protein